MKVRPNCMDGTPLLITCSSEICSLRPRFSRISCLVSGKTSTTPWALLLPVMTPSLQKYSCELCARRKVKCDRLEPCSHCSKSQSECIYRPPAPSRRHRKRPADEELLSKFTEYEGLLRKHNIDFQPLEKTWMPSPLEEKVVTTRQTSHPLQASNEIEQSTHAHIPERRSLSALTNVQSEAANRWYGLPKEVCGQFLPTDIWNQY